MEPTGRASPERAPASEGAASPPPLPHIDTARPIPPRPSPADESLRHLLRFVYTHNPFYVISAACVFYGLRVTFDQRQGELDTFALLAALAAYTLLLAVTAWAIVRWGGVWQDARSLLVLVVVSLLSMSMTFDDRLVLHRSAASACFLLGLAFASLLSETLLRVLGMRLPWLYRVPYHLFLGLFFLYPLWLASVDPLAADPSTGEFDLRVRLIGFPLIAGLLVLTLWPAVRLGPWYVRANGTPWDWPLYPGVLFGLLAFGAGVRAHCLTISFDLVPGSSGIFDWYFVVPVLLACAVLLLEASVASRNLLACHVAIAAPALLVYLAIPSADLPAVAADFLGQLTDKFGSPLYWTTMAVVVYYAVAALRELPLALHGLIAASLLATVVGHDTSDFYTLVAPRVAALLPLLVVVGWLAWRNASSRRVFVLAAVVLSWLTVWFWDTEFARFGLAIPLHLAWLVAVAIAARYRDPFARVLRYASATALVCAAVLAVGGREPLFPDLGHLARLGYLALVIAAALLTALATRRRVYLTAGLVNFALLVVATSVELYEILRWRVEGLKPLLWGLAFFVLAVVISLAEGGVWQSMSAWAARFGLLRGPDG
ncbi:MAG: hypothetical protein K2Y37_08165 [Pirellulales bacterium]|nr:hypothetical protein [Pirellulales bacterium]